MRRCCVLLFASTPGAFHRIHQVSTLTSQRPRTTLISSPELELANSDRGFLYSSKSMQSRNPTYINPLTIYLLAIVFRFLHPSIVVARTFAAFWMFAACLLLGVLAKRISGQRKIGIIVAGTALLTPWFFEIGRLVLDAHFSAFTVVVFLLAAYRIQSKETMELARHCDGRRKSRVNDIWLFQRTRPGAFVRIRTTLLRDHKAPFPWRTQDMARLRGHVGTTYSVQSVTFWRANKAALGSYLHQA